MADIRLSNGRSLAVQAVLPDVFRVRFSDAESDRESMLTRYGILKTGDHPDAVWRESDSRPSLSYCGATVELDPSECRLTVANEKVKICLQFTQRQAKNGLDQGFAITLDLDETERLFGLGDETRTMVMKRGHKADLWQANVSCYGPIPYVRQSWGTEENELLFSIGERAGSWPGMPEAFSFLIAVHTKTPPKRVLLDGEPVSCHYEDASHTAQFSVPAVAYADSGAVVRIGF